MPLSSALFDYPLPADLIAQAPLPDRDRSRLLVVDRTARSIGHAHFSDLPRFLRSGDRLFRNNATVLPARLTAVRPTGGKVECFLLHPTESSQVWRCLLKPARKLAPGAVFSDPGGGFRGEVIGEHGPAGTLVRIVAPDGASVPDIARRHGDIPLPPYIARPDSSQREADRLRYQTVYADPARAVAVAAPTAGLHFTPALLREIASQGIETFDLTLHVGLGTFRPVTAATIEAHPIHREFYEVPVATQEALFPPQPGRRIAVGTTAVRSIEDFLAHRTAPDTSPHLGHAAIYLFPPAAFRGVDALITNFHQPRSTLLCLVAAFLTPGTLDGVSWLQSIYAEAIARRYRFLSYGDAMLIV